LRILFAGTPANAAETLSALINSGHEVVAVLTREDAPVGRKAVVMASPVALIAEAAGIPTIKSNRLDETVNELLRTFDADLGVVVAFGAIFKVPTLEATKLGWINLHYSALPAWRGAAPVQHSIWSGQRETGVTLFWLDEGMDTGPIAKTVSTQIELGENAGDLLKRLTLLGISGLMELLPEIEAGLASREPQAAQGASVAFKLTRQRARIDWQQTAPKVEKQVLAMNPEPMAWCEHGFSQLRVLDAVALGATDWSSLTDENLSAGDVILRSERVLVGCGDGTLLELRLVQPAGKQPMAADAWARGIKTDWRLA
jgi:methionyl-tRNA formyltransferase